MMIQTDNQTDGKGSSMKQYNIIGTNKKVKKTIS